MSISALGERILVGKVNQMRQLRGDFRKKNRRFEDNRRIGEGGSSSNQKFKMILISDIF